MTRQPEGLVLAARMLQHVAEDLGIMQHRDESLLYRACNIEGSCQEGKELPTFELRCRIKVTAKIYSRIYFAQLSLARSRKRRMI